MSSKRISNTFDKYVDISMWNNHIPCLIKIIIYTMANYKLINMNVILDEYLYIGLNEHSLKKIVIIQYPWN